MALEFLVVKAEMGWNFRPKLDQRRGLRQVVEIDLPAVAATIETAEDGGEESRAPVGKMRALVVDVAGRRSGMGEIAVRPGFAWGGGIPPVGNPESLAQKADDRRVRRGELMHDRPRVGRTGRRRLRPPQRAVMIRRLAHVVVDEPRHGRASVRRAPQSENLHVDIVEQLAWIALRKRGPRRSFAAPNPDLFDGAVRLVPGVGLRHVEAVELLALRIKLPEHIVEGAVLEHEDDDMFDFRHVLTIGLRGSMRSVPDAFAPPQTSPRRGCSGPFRRRERAPRVARG